MSKKIRIGIVFISISILLSLSGCGRSAKQEDFNSVDNAENINTAETDMSEAANVIIPLKNDNIADDLIVTMMDMNIILQRKNLLRILNRVISFV